MSTPDQEKITVEESAEELTWHCANCFPAASGKVRLPDYGTRELALAALLRSFAQHMFEKHLSAT